MVSSNFLATTATTRAVQPAPCGRKGQAHCRAWNKKKYTKERKIQKTLGRKTDGKKGHRVHKKTIGNGG